MEHKDPIYYFFIVPIILLILQVIALFAIESFKQWVRNKLERLKNFISTYERRPQWRRTSLREAALQAEANRKQRIVDNHAKLTQQGIATKK